MSNIELFLKELKIKRTPIGGFDREAVYNSMRELSSLYQQEIRRLNEENGHLASDSRAAANELEQAEKEILLLKFQLEEQQKSRDKYESGFASLIQSIDFINAGKERILEEAKMSAEKIITEANEQRDIMNRECRSQKQQRDLLLAKAADVRQQYDILLETVRSSLVKMLSGLDALQKNAPNLKPDVIRTNAETNGGKFQIAVNDDMNCLVRMITESVGKHDV